MKKLCKLMTLVLVITTVLSGCTSQMNLPESNEPESVSENAGETGSVNEAAVEVEASENAAEEADYAAIVPVSCKQEFCDKSSEDDRLYVQGSYDILGVSADGFERLNESLQSLNKERQEEIVSQVDEYYEMGVSDIEAGDIPDEWLSFSSEYHADVVRSDEKLVSILEIFYSFAGGAHPNTYYRSVNFDTKTGKKLGIEDVVSDREAFIKSLEEETLKSIDKDMLIVDNVSEVIKELMDETVSENELTFIMDYEGLEVVFSPYELTAYAAGAQRVRLSYADYPELFDAGYMAAPQNYIEKVYEGGRYYTGRPGTGDRKEVTLEELSDEYGTISSCTVLLDGKAGQADTEDYYYNSRMYIAHMGDKSFCIVEKQSDNDYTFMAIYDLNSDAAVKKETVDGHIDSMIMPADPAALRIVKRCDLLSTYSVVQLHKMNEDGSVTPVSDFGYMENEDMPSHRLKKTISVNMLDDEEGKSMHEVTLGSQTELKVYRTDLDKIVDMKLNDGNVVRFVVEYGEDEFYGQMVDNTPIEEVFEKVWFAG